MNDQVIITINPLPTITTNPTSTTIVQGNSANIIASGAATYSWSPTTGLSCTTCASPTATPSATTSYVVTGTDLNGCSSTATAQVIVEPIVACPTCTTTLPPTLTASPTSRASYCINNDLFISGNVTFKGSEFKIASNVTIYVQDGFTLTIEGSHLYSCGSMWKGIVVKPTGRLIITDFTIPATNNKITSFIEDAIVAVKIENNIVNSGKLTLTNVLFNRNQTGVKISNYSANVSPYPFSINNCIFTCRKISFNPFDDASNTPWDKTSDVKGNPTFPNTSLQNVFINNTNYQQTGSDANLKAPFANQKSKAGLELENVGLTLNAGSSSSTYREFTIGSGTNMSIFDNQTIGVNLLNSNFTSVNSVFQNTGSRGAGIYASAKADKNNRIQVIPVALTVGNNKFVDCGRAMRVDNYLENNIQYCDVRSSQANWDPTSTKYGFDIRTNRYKNYRFLYNSIYNVTGAILINTFNSDYNISGTPNYGQYAGNINVDFNTIRPNIPTTNLISQTVTNAIFLENAGEVTQYANGSSSVITTNGNNIQASRGIYYNNWRFQYVQSQNNIVTVRNNQYLNASNQIYFGISVNNSPPAAPNVSFIRSNTITGFYTPSANSNTLLDPKLTGIESSLSGSVLVSCNSTSNTVNGIGFRGTSNGSLFRNNTMQNHRYGFFLDQGAEIGQQGIITNPSDNQWLGSYPTGNYKTMILSTIGTSTTSPLFVRPVPNFNPEGSGWSQSPIFQNTLYSSANESLKESTVTSPFPPVACFQIILSGIFKNEQEKIALDTSIYSNNYNGIDEKMKYISKEILFNVLKKDLSLLDSSSILNNFYIQNSSSAFESLYTINKYLESGNLSGGMASNTAFIAANNIEENYKKYQEIYGKYKIFNNWSATDSTDLKNLAEKCPFSDGAVVYKARALFNLLFEKNEIFPDLCDSRGGERSMKIQDNSEDNQNGISVFPNPTKGEVFVNMSDLEETKVNIQVFDASGKIVFENQNLDVTNGLANFTLNVKNGIYFVHVLALTDSKVKVEKLIINK